MNEQKGRKRLGLIVVVLIVGLFLGGAVGYAARLVSEPEVIIETVERTVTKEVPKEIVKEAEVTKEAPVEVTETVEVTKEAPIGALWDVRFSPKGGCADLLITWIDSANETLHVMIYSFTRDDVAQALLRAKERGVEIKIVMERQQMRTSGSRFGFLTENGFDLKIENRSALMHNKVAIIDGYVVITGSYNWSKSAEDRNNENLIALIDENLARKYLEAFEEVWNAERTVYWPAD